jgi:hypothetical protein
MPCEGNIVKTIAPRVFMSALLFGTSLSMAQTPADEHAGHHPEGTPPAASSAQPPGKPADSAAMARMQDNMKKMQDLMAKVRASKEGPERQQLLQQHSKAMREQMDMMRGMPSGGMKMGDGMMNQMMMNHQAMQGRMQMMEMMMGQMMEHQDAQQDVKPAR